ncbi:hypothetical protein HZH68_000482 [Vespula germanica]|uniref:Uncharacterized protein n=1 Tax=Vespula germanica TaxID=30212 RepID=A0A834U5T1_VESGE|nr:hypothetical protein HZH68_000482 [Vespula germanica]
MTRNISYQAEARQSEVISTRLYLLPHAPSGSIIDYDDNLDSGHVPFQYPKGTRYREYDTCKCRYSFNCPSVGLKFGACADGKRYCCFNSKRYPTLISGDPRDRH